MGCFVPAREGQPSPFFNWRISCSFWRSISAFSCRIRSFSSTAAVSSAALGRNQHEMGLAASPLSLRDHYSFATHGAQKTLSRATMCNKPRVTYVLCSCNHLFPLTYSEVTISPCAPGHSGPTRDMAAPSSFPMLLWPYLPCALLCSGV